MGDDFPIPLRPLLAIRPKVMARCLEITTSAINAYYRKKSGLTKPQPKTGAVTLIQRFGGAINLNVHFHQLFIDGVCGLDAGRDFTEYQWVAAPSLAELDQVLKQIITRVTRYLERQGIIIRDEEEHLQMNLQDDDGFTRLQASSSVYRFLMGPNKGKKALVLKTVDQDHSSSQGLVVKASGFSLHAGVSCKAEERKKLERICRYIARPAISEERLSVNQKGQVVYQLKKAYDDGTTHVVMEPLELLEKKNKNQRMSWARLLKRVFNIDIETCGVCGGKMRIIKHFLRSKGLKAWS